MRALTLTQRPRPGTLADVIQMAEISEPVPRKREVLVRVLASSINIDDLHVAEGTFYGGIPIGARPSMQHPVTPGSDLSGTVVKVGEGVRSVHDGDAVFGVQVPFRAGGAWEELCAVDERWLTRKPEKISFASAAACGVSGLVALSAIHALKIMSGLRIVIVGATGGIGGMAVQLAARAGADVIGICSPKHVEQARRLGCSQVLDYHGDPWDRRLQGVRIDRVLDTVGGCDIEASGRRVLARDGIFVTVVGPERFIGDRDLGWFGVVRVLALVGYRIVVSRFRGPRYVLTGPSIAGGKALPEVAEAAASGVLPPIDSIVPFELESVRQALKRAAAHYNSGRIVIRVNNAAA